MCHARPSGCGSASRRNATVSCEPLDEHIFDKLDAGTLDLLIYGRAAPDRYRSQHLFTDQFVCVVAAEHPLARRTSVSLPQYLRWPHLNIDLGQPGIDRALEARGTARRTTLAGWVARPAPVA